METETLTVKKTQGLFRKASELSLLCGAELGIIVQSPGNKVFTFETSSLESLINRVDAQNWNPKGDDGGKYDQAEESRAVGEFWWDQPFENLELHQLQEYLVGLEFLRDEVAKKIKSR